MSFRFISTGSLLWLALLAFGGPSSPDAFAEGRGRTKGDAPPAKASASQENAAEAAESGGQSATVKKSTSDSKSQSAPSAKGAGTHTSIKDQLDAKAKKKPYSFLGFGEFRTKAISDEDPSNDRYMRFFLRGYYKPLAERLPTLSAILQFDMIQNFSAEEGESGFLFQDMAFGSQYTHKLAVPFFGQQKDITFLHRLLFYLPTSRASWNRGLVTTPYWLTRVSFEPLKNLRVETDLNMQYRFFKYSSMAGAEGTPNTQFVFGGYLRGEYTIFSKPKWGELLVGLDVNDFYSIRYAARDSLDQHRWFQAYGWSTYLMYSPIQYVIGALTLEQGGQVIRNGIVNTFVAHRDETELSFALYFLY